MTPVLSIVIPSHCRADLLRACLASVQRHAPPGTETIVVDDGSAEGLVSRTAGEFAGVQSLRLPQRQGFCIAANAGIRAARAPVVEMLNDDTEVTEGWAGIALARFADGHVGAVAPLVLRRAGDAGEADTIDSAGDQYYVGGVARKRGHGQLLRWLNLPAGPVFGASASSAFYRRDVLLRVGAFPDQFGAYFEDVDVAFRLRRAGFEIAFEPSARVLHRVSASYGRPRRRLLEQQSLNEERVFWRNLTGRALWQALLPHSLVLAAKSYVRWSEGDLVPFALGRLRILGELAELYRHRRWLRTLGPEPDLDRWQVEKRFSALI